MCPSDDAPADEDRAAILARRQRFIALALSGLAAACTSPEKARPRPCLEIASPEEVEKARLEQEAAEREKLRQQQLEATPTPCLSPPRPPDPDPNADPKAIDTKGAPPTTPHSP